MKCNGFEFEIFQLRRGEWCWRMVRDRDGGPVHDHPSEPRPKRQAVSAARHFAAHCVYRPGLGWTYPLDSPPATR